MTDKRNVSVLVVDDEPSIRVILSRGLSSAGFNVELAEDGVVALSKMKERTFEMVITDVQMPNLNGLELLEKIRTHFPETGVILITGQRASLHDKNIKKAGADALISKPFRNVEIVKTLTQAYRDRCLKRALEQRESREKKKLASALKKPVQKSLESE